MQHHRAALDIFKSFKKYQCDIRFETAEKRSCVSRRVIPVFTRSPVPQNNVVDNGTMTKGPMFSEPYIPKFWGPMLPGPQGLESELMWVEPLIIGWELWALGTWARSLSLN